MSLARLARWSRRGLPRTARLAWARATGRRLPYSITFLLTHRCNFRCAYSDIQEAKRGDGHRRDLWWCPWTGRYSPTASRAPAAPR